MTRAHRLLADVRDLFATFGQFGEDVQRRHAFQPAPGSQAQLDWSSGHGVNIEAAYSRASQTLAVSDDYLECLRRVLTDEVPERGVFMLCRGVVDNSARAWWLLPPHPDPWERARRGLLERFNDVNELIRAKTPADEAADRREVEVLRLELEGMVEAAKRDGYDVAGKRPPSVDGLVRPSATALMREINGESGAFLYKFLSASAHGATYALLQGMDTENDVEEWQGGLVAGPNDRFQPMGTLLAGTIQVHCGALDRYLSSLGWSVPEWTSIHSRAMETTVELAQAGSGD